MNFEEYAAKPVLAAAGIPVPPSQMATTPDEAAQAAEKIGKVVVKAQVPTGKRGKAGGIKLADTPEEAKKVATAILGMTIGEFTVEKVLVEAQAPIRKPRTDGAVFNPRRHGHRRSSRRRSQASPPPAYRYSHRPR
jgi:succinyl-CoA synthetase beta subunit